MENTLKDKLGDEDYQKLMVTITRIKSEAYNQGLADGKRYWFQKVKEIWATRKGKAGAAAATTVALGLVFELFPGAKGLIPPQVLDGLRIIFGM